MLSRPFTSCKDYDDDINDLRSKVDGLNTSLTTLINDKVTSVSNQVALLEKQLGKVEESYAAADAALQKELDGVKATGIANGDNIKTLLAEVADLKTAKTSLENAIKELKDGLAAANANIKGNSDNIIALLAKDTELEKGITGAKADAQKAFDEATKALNKANENASNIASLQTKEQGDFDNLQKQITDNLTSVTAEIGKVNTALNDYIKLNDGKVAKLDEQVGQQKADITAIKTKLGELATKDTEILNAIDKAKKDQKEINDAQTKKNEELAAEIKANADAIDLINHVTLRDLEDKLVDEVIPAEVLKQLNAVLTERLKTFFENDVKTLVATETGKNKALIDALDEKVDSLDEAVDEAIAAAYGLACLYTEYYTDSVAGAKAIEAKKAFDAADDSIRQLVEDSIGKVAKALEIAQTNLSSNFTKLDEQINGKGESKGIVGQIADLEYYFKPAGEGSTLTNLEKSLIENEEVIAKVNDIVAAANGEINSMITSINLFAGPHNYAHAGQDGIGYREFDHDLNFTYAIEKENVFPNAAHQGLVDDSIKFTKGFIHTYPDSILVRVSPVNAVLDKDFIALINSQGQDVVGDSIVKVLSVEKYKRPEGQYLTRATNGGETGLWVIKFKLQEEKAEVWDKFKSASVVDVKGNEKKILYSVGVKNTKKAEKDDNRYVVSEYDLTLGTHKAFHIWNFNVNEKSVAQIHNRYVKNEQKPNDGAILYTDDTSKDYEDSYNEELTYAPYKPYYTSNTDDDCNRSFGAYMYDENNQLIVDEFGEAVIWDYPGYTYAEMKKQQTKDDEAYTFNVTDRHNHNTIHAGGYFTNGIDNRDEFKSLSIEFENGWADIDIEFPTITCESNPRPTEIAGFYVLLDQNFAKESTTSEVAAWTQYIYENVGFQRVNGYQLDANGKRVFKYDTETNDDQGKKAKDGSDIAQVINGVKKAHLFKGTKGTIRIKDARSAKGDVIGFRVFAVNLDGTLYDPDGRAFYVKVGDPEEDQVLNFKVRAFKQSGDQNIQEKDIIYTKNDGSKVKDLDIVGYNAEAAKEFKNQFINIQKKELSKGGQYHLIWTWADGNPAIRNDHYSNSTTEPKVGTDDEIEELFDFFYTPNDGTAEQPVDLEDATKCEWYQLRCRRDAQTRKVEGWLPLSSYHGDLNNIKVVLKDAARLQNDSTYHLTLVVKLHDADGVVSVVNTVAVNVTKLMPNRLPEAFKVRVGMEDVAKAVDFKLRPAQESYTWEIDNWFDATSTDGTYGFASAIGVANAEGVIVPGKWNTGGGKTPIYYDGDQEMARATRSQGLSSQSDRGVRWAQDVHPYNFEEIFTGLVFDAAGDNNVFDTDYKFVFEGAGAIDLTKSYDTVDDINGDAVSLFRSKMAGDVPTYKGFSKAHRPQTGMQPAYYLPLVYYGVMDKWGDKDHKLSVKAGYTYHDINFVMKDGKVVRDADSNTNGGYYGTDYEVTPNFFDENGNFVTKATDAAFQCFFTCAIHNEFKSALRYQFGEITKVDLSQYVYPVKEYNADNTPKTRYDESTLGTIAANPIPYGAGFTVWVDSIGVVWVSDLAVYPHNGDTWQDEAIGASYFMTNFEQNTNIWTSKTGDNKGLVAWKVDKDGHSYYTDSLTRLNPTINSNGYNIFESKSGKSNRWIGLADFKEVKIKEVKINKASGSVTLKDATIDRIKDYFNVTAELSNGRLGLTFSPKDNSLNPTQIKNFEFKFTTSAKLVHQWAHTNNLSGDSQVIYWGLPLSAQSLSRRTR